MHLLKILLFLLLSISLSKTPTIKIISPIEHNPIITTGKTTIFGETSKTDALYLNNNKIDVQKGLFRITLPEQKHGKTTYRLSAKNNQTSSYKDINVITLKTLLDNYTSPYKKEIDILLTLDILRPYLGTDFYKPDFFLTKAELAFFLTKLHQYEPLEYTAKYNFKDLFPNHWAYDYIQVALNKKLISAKEANFFGTESYITRKELASLLKNLLAIQDTSQIKPFVDINYNNAEEKTLSDVAISGYLPREWTSKKEIYPNKAVSRGEFAFIISRTDKLREKILEELGIELELNPTQKDLGYNFSSLELTFSLIDRQTYKINLLSNTERKIIYIELMLSDKYHHKKITIADNGKGLDKIKDDNIFTSAVDLSAFNKNELIYEYKMFNVYNLIEEAGKGKINYSNGNLSTY